jgi:hypothetical protein
LVHQYVFIMLPQFCIQERMSKLLAQEFSTPNAETFVRKTFGLIVTRLR